MITAENVQVNYGSARAVAGVDLTVPDSGMLGLVGPNGSGKTTLLRALYGSASLTAGRVLLDGEDLTQVKRREIARTVAVVAQERDAASSGMPMTVAELAMLGRLPHQSFGSRSGERDREIVEDSLDAVGMTSLARRGLSALSGGERQRALIARALVQQARHVLLDEPTNHLDIRYQHDVLELVAGLPGSVVVLHDLNLAARYCDRLVVLDHGMVVATGTPDEVLTPEVLEPVYGLPVTRLDVDGEITLVFPRPARTTPVRPEVLTKEEVSS